MTSRPSARRFRKLPPFDVSSASEAHKIREEVRRAFVLGLSRRVRRYIDYATHLRMRLIVPHIRRAVLIGNSVRAVVGRRVVKAVPAFVNGYKPLIASLGHLGRGEEAAPYIQKLLSLEPDFTIEKFRKSYPFKLPGDCGNYCKGLQLAGIPKH